MKLFGRTSWLVFSLIALGQAIVDEYHTDPTALELSIDVIDEIQHGDPLTITCTAKLRGAGDDYDLKHLWLHDEKNDGKIAAYFPGRTRKKRQVRESHSDMYTEDGAAVEEYVEKEEWEDPDPEKYADHFQATLHDMQVENEQIQEGDHTTYILRAHYPSSTCYQQTGYHCWAFAIPIPTPAETEQKRVRVNPC